MEILFKQFAFLNLQIFLATEPLPDIYKYNIATVELFLLGNHLKMVRSKNISTKQFQITGFDVIIPPDQSFRNICRSSKCSYHNTICYLSSCKLAK